MPSATVDSGAHNYAGQDHETDEAVNMAQPNEPVPDLPSKTARKEDHVAYVVATTSLTSAEAEALTKEELFVLEGRDEPSAGSSSSTFATSQDKSGRTSSPDHPSPARDAESPLTAEEKKETTSSSASSTAGSTRATSSRRQSRSTSTD